MGNPFDILQDISRFCRHSGHVISRSQFSHFDLIYIDIQSTHMVCWQLNVCTVLWSQTQQVIIDIVSISKYEYVWKKWIHIYRLVYM